MYELKWDKKALDFLSKLEKDIKQRIWDKIQACKINPFRYLEHLEEIEGFKLRVGDYRVIVDVDNISFADSAEDLGRVIEKVNANIHGLF